MESTQEPITICISGATGKVAYSFIPILLSGSVFGKRLINLRLLGRAKSLNILKGVVLEVKDCVYPLLNQLQYGDNPNQMFKNADVIVFLASFPSKQTMQRKDLLHMNKQIFIQQAKALDHAKKNFKCVVVSNPSNTSAYIISHYNTKIQKQNITCLSRLDHNRAVHQISEKISNNTKYSEIQGVMIFGNHSLTQYPCIEHIKVKGKPVLQVVEKQWLETYFLEKVQKRGHQILGARGVFSIFPAAEALGDHLKDWYNGATQIVSMGVVSDGSYGIPAGIWSSFPVKCSKNFNYEIVKGLQLSEFCKQMIKLTVQQLQKQILDADLQQKK